MSGLTLPPGTPCLEPAVEASPPGLRSLARLQTFATRAAVNAAPAASKPGTGELPGAKPVVAARPLAAFKEHASVLRQNLVGAEKTLHALKSEDFQELKKALLKVNKMVSQMESVTEALRDKRRNLKNELRTLEEENALLQEALFRERCKALTKARSSATVRFDRKRTPPPPSPLLRDSGVVYSSVRQLLFAPSIPRYWPADDSDSAFDFIFENAPRSLSASTIAPNLSVNPVPSASAKRGRGISTPVSTGNTAGVNRPATTTRGNNLALRPRPRPIVRPLTANESIASLTLGPPPALPRYRLLLAGTAPSPAPFTPEPLADAGQNEIQDLANKLSNRNNRFAGEKSFSVLEWCPGLD